MGTLGAINRSINHQAIRSFVWKPARPPVRQSVSLFRRVIQSGRKSFYPTGSVYSQSVSHCRWPNIFCQRSFTFASLGFALLVFKDNTTKGFLGSASSGFLEPLVITGELSHVKKWTRDSTRDNMMFNIRASNWLTLYKQYSLNVHVSCQSLFCSSHLLQLNLHHKEYKQCC